MGISDRWGKPKPFSSDRLVTENEKSVANAAIFLTKGQVFTIWRFINAFTLSPLNGVSRQVFLNHIKK